VVVNKWASWCGPCRFEFPFFQEQVKQRGTRIAFLGVDSEDARGEAREFLDDFPVPYPSFFDSGSEIAELLGSERNFPTTTFYDREGALIYTKPGGYASEAALEDDIREYAIGGARRGAGQ
jgi:cytochrome c biogenesis protein CcmG/thiol:disulfide interchange protein DsbE